MKRIFLSLAMLAVMVTPSVLAQQSSTPATYVLDTTSSKITFNCETDLHDFSGTGTGLVGCATFDAAVASQKVGGRVTLPVATLNTGDKDRDKDMREDVLPVKKHPLILFTPIEIKAGDSIGKGGKMELRGTLTINGVPREMTLQMTVDWPSKNQCRIRGSQLFKLTEFKIDPPGAIWPMRVHDAMTFSIDLGFKKT